MKRTLSTLLVMLTIVATGAQVFAGVSVARKFFATDIVAREPVDSAEIFSPKVGKVFFFTQFLNIGGPTTLIHAWTYKGQTVAEVELYVEGKSWRTWSSKTILPEQTGEWTVEVRDDNGGVIDSATFTVE